MDIANKILKSKKYKDLYPKTVKRVASSTGSEDTARKLLHQIWGAYYTSRPDFEKLLDKVNERLKSGEDKKQVSIDILKIHSSTRERLPILDEFYKRIFEITGLPSSIADHACGLNPLTIPWMGLAESTKYYAFDIDLAEIRFLQEITTLLEIDIDFEAQAGDLLIDTFPPVDVAFLLKILPPIERQEKGSSLEVIKRLKSKYIVVSFPTKSLGGKEKGMERFYVEEFENLVSTDFNSNKLQFGEEIVFILAK